MKDDLIAKVQKDVTDEQKYRDGIPQIAVGLFLVVTMLLLMSGHGNTFVVFIPLMPLLIEALRRRITYPRVGYAKVIEHKSGRSQLLWAVLALLIAGAIVFFFRNTQPGSLSGSVNLHYLLMWTTAIVLVLIGVIAMKRSRSLRVAWYLAVVPVFIAAAFVFKLHKQAVFLVVMAFGALHILLGLISLRTFIRDYPVLKDE